jgi:hypothetical protein
MVALGGRFPHAQGNQSGLDREKTIWQSHPLTLEGDLGGGSGAQRLRAGRVKSR